MRPYLEITSVETQRDESGSHAVFVTLDGPKGIIRLAVSHDAMLCYFQFQREAMAATGQLYTHIFCEGRPIDAANENWKWMMRNSLSAPVVQPAQQASTRDEATKPFEATEPGEGDYGTADAPDRASGGE